MATVAELSAPYADVLLAPRPGAGVCHRCFNLTAGYDRCWACAHGGDVLDVVVPISYSVATEQLHLALRAYKRSPAPWAEPFALGLAAILGRFLERHERCVARAAGVARFAVVTTVPSGERRRDETMTHPLARIVGELVAPTRGRYAPLLARSDVPAHLHAFDPGRFVATTALPGRSVLLIDDTWTTGASAQSAAAALKRAGANPVAAVVIGRHLNRGWHENDRRLHALPTPFDWDSCALCPSEIEGDGPVILKRG